MTILPHLMSSFFARSQLLPNFESLAVQWSPDAGLLNRALMANKQKGGSEEFSLASMPITRDT